MRTTRSLLAAVGALLAVVTASRGQDYTPMRFTDRMNWTDRPPQLVRMILDTKAEGGTNRRVAHPFKDRAILERPVTNVIILVHGHNEEEKAGFSATTAPEPWWFSYKRDVWTIFYETFQKEAEDHQNCTAFYEFIYPSYWPIYTPVEGHADQLLGRCFERALLDGAVNDDRRLAQWLSPKAASQVNLFFVAHSMGGLVARAGIRRAKEVWPHFRQLVTWGTPHHGSPLVTLGYAIREYTPRTGLGYLRTEDSQAFQDFFRTVQIDSPGARDLRWDNGYEAAPRYLSLNTLFMDTPRTLANPGEFDFRTGSYLINNNLRNFNRTDPFFNGERYTFLYGVTSKRLTATSLPWYAFVPKRSPGFQTIETAAGATMLPYALTGAAGPAPNPARPADTDSDGAVPLFSMSGVGVCAPVRAINLGNVDHEEYFGAPNDGRFPNAVARMRGEDTAERTLKALGLTMERCRCPEIQVKEPVGLALPEPGKVLRVGAKLEWPLELVKEPGKNIRRAQAILRGSSADKQAELGDMKVSPNGDLSGDYTMPNVELDERRVVVRVTFNDGSVLEGEQVLSRPTVFKFRLLREAGRKGEFKSPEGQRVGLPFMKRFLEAPEDCRLRIPSLESDGSKDIALQRKSVPADELYWFLARPADKPADTSGNFVKDEGSSLTGRFLGDSTQVAELDNKYFTTVKWTIRARLIGERLIGTITYEDWYYTVTGSGSSRKVVQHRGTIVLEFDAEPVD